ncbi:MAG: hypothetical protein ACRC8S_01245 [Fimbriiglobus sp.]
MGRWFCAGLLSLAMTALVAQSPLPPREAPAKAVDPVLLDHLQKWEKVMKDSKTFYAKGTKTVENKLKRIIKKYDVEFMGMTPGKVRFRDEAQATPGGVRDGNDYTTYIVDDTMVYEYDGMAKQLTETKLDTGISKRVFMMEMLSGSMTATKVLERFEVRISQVEKHYVHLEFKPKLRDDREDFDSMTIILFLPKPELDKKDKPYPHYLPRQFLVYGKNAQVLTSWDFDSPMINRDEITTKFFEKAPAPEGWKVVVKKPPTAPITPR